VTTPISSTWFVQRPYTEKRHHAVVRNTGRADRSIPELLADEFATDLGVATRYASACSPCNRRQADPPHRCGADRNFFLFRQSFLRHAYACSAWISRAAVRCR
jgi:hypothetical protein